MYHCLFVHSPTERYLGSFQVLAVTYKAAINMFLCGYKFSVPLGKYHRSWLLDPMVRVCLIFQETVKLFFKVAVSFLHSHQQWMRVPVAPYCHQHLMLSVFCASFYLLTHFFLFLMVFTSSRIPFMLLLVIWPLSIQNDLQPFFILSPS